MRTTRFSRTFVILAGLSAGCSTAISVKEVDGKQEKTVIEGVPFRMTAPHKIHLYEWSDAKGGYRHLSTHSLDFADTDKLFTLSFGADLLADPTFALDIGEDGAVQKLQLDSQINTDEALGAAVAGAKEVKDALLAVEKREQERLDRREADEKDRFDDATAQENARLAAYEAFLKAETAVGEYTALLSDPSATQVQLLAKRNEAYALQARANTLYRLAGMTPPYELDFPD